MEFANATVSGNPPALELEPLLRSLFVVFFVTALGYGAVITSFIPKTSLAGINVLVGRICLPILIFRSVAQIDYSALEVEIVFSCILAKFVSVLLGSAIAGYGAKSPGIDEHWITRAGLYSMFTHSSNDLAIGLVVIESLYPPTDGEADLVAMTYVIVGASTICVYSLCIALFKVGQALAMGNNQAGLEGAPSTRAKSVRSKSARSKSARSKSHAPNRSSCGETAARVVVNLLHSPSMLSILFGVAFSLVFPVTPGDASSHKNIPLTLDQALEKGGTPYAMAALFGGGMSVVGKLNKLRGKSLVVPLLLSVVKVVVAPFVAYYFSKWLYNGSEKSIKFSQYCFVYSSLPSSSLALIMAQSVQSPVTDMLSGATVLVMLLWTPVMILVSGLLTNPSLGRSTTLDISITVVSGLGYFWLALTGVMSSDWRKFPKCFIPILGLLGAMKNYFSTQCLRATIWPSNAHEHDVAVADPIFYFWSNLFGLWMRLFITFAVAAETYFIHKNGKVSEKQTSNVCSRWKITLIVAGVASLALHLLKTQSFELTGGYYPCIYQYSDVDIYIDVAILSVEAIVCIFVTCGMLYRPTGRGNTTSPAMVHFEEPFLSAGGSNDNGGQRGLECTAPNLVPTNHEKKKCQISGDFMFKMKIFLGFCIAGQVAAVLDGAQLLRTDVPRTDAVLLFVHLLCSVTVSGRGILLFSTFIFMRDNGWQRALSKLRSFYRQIVYAADVELLESYGTKNRRSTLAKTKKRLGKDYVKILKDLLLKLVEETDLFVDRRYRCVTYEACVPGSDLLGYLERMAEGNSVRIGNREQALKVADDLFELGLIHHVTYEHVFEDSGYFYAFNLEDDGEAIGFD
jgi:predicted permease